MVAHSLTAVLLAITIIGIPLAVASLKMAALALWPYGRTVVSIRRGDVPPPNAIAVPAV
ncbi:MAG TPA: YccF domain-containing protein [Jiangellaceae bacterium]|nr:YccF domain-containing protein [Jiangellaceae bacterium]